MMVAAKVVVFLAGATLVVGTLGSAIRTVVLPRGVPAPGDGPLRSLAVEPVGVPLPGASPPQPPYRGARRWQTATAFDMTDSAPLTTRSEGRPGPWPGDLTVNGA